MDSLDRTVFTIHTFESAAHQRAFWLSRPSSERLAAAWCLTCMAWNLDPNEDHPLDRSHFSMRKHSDTDLLEAKRATARPKDLDDIENLG